MNYTVDFEPVGRRGEFSSDDTLLDCARDLSVDIVSICGGAGSCERCKVQVIEGEVSELSMDEEFSLSEEEIEQGYRLACKTYPLSNVKIHVPPESLTAPQRTQVEGLEIDVEIDPIVRFYDVQLTEPTLEAIQSDETTVWLALAEQGVARGQIDFRVKQSLSEILRENDWKVRVAIRNNEIVAVGSPDARWYGMGVDIGTTKVAGYLIDLETGATMASKGLMNPQISYGEDVVSRIVAASKSEKDAAKLQYLLTDALSQLAKELTEELDLEPSAVVEAVVVGNTAIHHLALGLPVKQLGLAPYVPAVETALDVKARDINVGITPGGYVHLLPNIAGYVGADHVSMLLATKLTEMEGTNLAIDIGTNTEICLNHKGSMTSVSCASGPAFEGAHIKFGMRAAPGAIEHFRLTDGKMEVQTIGGEDAIGICGSGLLDIVAELRKNDVINHRGQMTDHPLLERDDDISHFVLAQRNGLAPVTLTQLDVRELQLAKAAIRMGILALVEKEGLEESDIDHIIIAGAFGTYIDVESAIAIGMLPDLPLERYTQVGNAAGTGTRMAMLSTAERKKADAMVGNIDYIELAQVPGFSKRYAQVTYL